MDELLLETLAFAEGPAPSIHPFTDFNGRVYAVISSFSSSSSRCDAQLFTVDTRKYLRVTCPS